MKHFSLIVFALSILILFSGQQRRIVRTQPAKPAQPTSDTQQQTRLAQPEIPPAPAAKERKEFKEPKGSESESPAAIPPLFLPVNTIRYPSTDDGRNHTITLAGDPQKEGLYVTRTIFPRGAKTPPHFHADSRTVVILKGTYYFGAGDTFDETKMIALPTGSFYTEPANMPHFTWAKDGEVIVQTTAVGPSETQLVPLKEAEVEKNAP
ncbi:hypothetical protein FACS189454_00610 [Planctomycetales bacterium]|nr:hypothetical protein FACS189454_00610 [Planctomycetales bacterium]